MWRAAPPWAALLAGACVMTAMLVLVSAASEQPTGSADLSATKTVNPRGSPVGENQTFTIKVTNQRGDTARDEVMRNPLPDEVSQIPGGPVAELAPVEQSVSFRLLP